MKLKIKYLIVALIAGLFVFSSCSVSIPPDYVTIDKVATIYPDYQGIVVPVNIAPLNFKIRDDADGYITRIKGDGGGEITVKGSKVQFNIKKWHQLLEANQGKNLTVEVFLQKDEKWYKYRDIKIMVTSDVIDEYISYRLIQPSYIMYDELSIRQRNITNFEERDIYNNTAIGDPRSKQCINCHSYQNYKTDNMQFHIRKYDGGTLIVSDGVLRKVNIKTDNLISGGVYPAWHPTEKLIAYSVNNTGQRFYSKDLQKVEVLDTESDLVLFDMQKNEVTIIRNDSNAFETFPAWSPDGKTLYYASAYFEPILKIPKSAEVSIKFKELKYDIFRLSFDPATKEFGKPELVFQASALDKSATFPRISPDGNYLLFSMGDYGVFHIWHTSSDLVLMDLRTGKLDMMEKVNSDNVESYHSWSSNGRWIIFSSRRDDGSYTRLYIANFDREGNWSKPFILPQKDPDFYSLFFKSFNVPEFMVEPVKLSVKDFAKSLQGETIQTIYKGNYTSSAVEPDMDALY